MVLVDFNLLNRVYSNYIMKRAIFLFLLLFFLFTPVTYAHPGNTASDGCHYCRTRCDYWGEAWNERHCHGGSSDTLPVQKTQTYEPPTVIPTKYILPTQVTTKTPIKTATPTKLPSKSLRPENTTTLEPSKEPTKEPSKEVKGDSTKKESVEVAGTEIQSGDFGAGLITGIIVSGLGAWGYRRFIKRS